MSRVIFVSSWFAYYIGIRLSPWHIARTWEVFGCIEPFFAGIVGNCSVSRMDASVATMTYTVLLSRRPSGRVSFMMASRFHRGTDYMARGFQAFVAALVSVLGKKGQKCAARHGPNAKADALILFTRRLRGSVLAGKHLPPVVRGSADEIHFVQRDKNVHPWRR